MEIVSPSFVSHREFLVFNLSFRNTNELCAYFDLCFASSEDAHERKRKARSLGYEAMYSNYKRKVQRPTGTFFYTNTSLIPASFSSELSAER